MIMYDMCDLSEGERSVQRSAFYVIAIIWAGVCVSVWVYLEQSDWLEAAYKWYTNEQHLKD